MYEEQIAEILLQSGLRIHSGDLYIKLWRDNYYMR